MKILKPLHMHYAQRINRACLGQGWFFSSALDENCLCVRGDNRRRSVLNKGSVPFIRPAISPAHDCASALVSNVRICAGWPLRRMRT